MENERKVRIISLVAIIVAVIGLTIAFAAMSRTLNIKGSTNVDPVNFDIHFKNITLQSKTETASVTGTPTPSSGNTSPTINNMVVTLAQPNDSVTYTLDIENEGDVDAEINLITPPTLTSDQSALFDFTVVYTDNGAAPARGDMLGHGEVRNITIVFKYKDITDENLLPDEPLTFNLSYSIEYIQSNRKVTTTTAQASAYGEEIASKQISENITATYYGGTEVAKAETNSNVVQMSYADNRVADDTRYEGGTLIISGSGAMPDYEYFNPDLLFFLADVSSTDELMTKYNESTNTFNLKYNPINIIIGEGITKIGNYTFFQYFPSIVNVTLPSTITSIGSYAFASCTNLENINLSEGLQIIGNSAFGGTAIEVMRFPSTMTEINDIFDNNNAKYMTEIYLPSSIMTIDNYTFKQLKQNSTIYCETQAVANLLIDNSNYYPSKTTVIVDPTKFN